jgi:hypothetical protein
MPSDGTGMHGKEKVYGSIPLTGLQVERYNSKESGRGSEVRWGLNGCPQAPLSCLIQPKSGARDHDAPSPGSRQHPPP